MAHLGSVWLLACHGLVDGDGAVVPAADAIAVRGGKIAAVGKRAELAERWPEAPVVAYEPAWVTPGLANAHDHIAFRRSRLPLAEHFALPEAAQMAFGAATAARALLEGVTAVRDMGSPRGLTAGIAASIAAGRYAGPLVLSPRSALTVPGGAGQALSVCVTSTAAAGAEVERLADDGAAFIKVFASTDGSAPDQAVPDEPMLAAICRAAHRRDLIVVAHATTRDAVDACVAAGVRCIEHGVGIDDALARLMAREDVWYVPTLSGFKVIADDGSRWGRAPHVVAYFKGSLQAQRRAFEAALEAGVHVAVGTDSLGTMALEAALMRQYGMAAAQVVSAGISGGAQLLRLPGGAGRLVPGAPADLAVWPANPLAGDQPFAAAVATVREGVLYYAASLSALFPDPDPQSERMLPDDHN